MVHHMFRSSARKAGTRTRLCAVATPLFDFGVGAQQNARFLAVLVVVCVLVGTLLAVMAWRAKRARHMAAQAQQNSILETLQRVMDEHARVDMFPAQRSGNANVPTVSGTCTACGPEGVHFEFLLTPEATNWAHKVVDIYFRVPQEDAFFVFSGTIRQMAAKHDRLRIGMDVPFHLRKEQKRGFFRVSLSSLSVPALALWHVGNAVQALDEVTPHALGRPLFVFRPEKINHLSLLDVSAGGARLRLSAERCKELGVSYNPGDGFILMLVFGNRQGVAESRQFWFKCLCRHKGMQTGSRDPFIGLQFQSWCLTSKLTEPVAWQSMGENGEVPPLFDWLMRYTRELQQAAKAQPAPAPSQSQV